MVKIGDAVQWITVFDAIWIRQDILDRNKTMVIKYWYTTYFFSRSTKW